MRGKQLLLRLSLWQVGITPARAGKTLLKSSRKSWTGDHPRACGENRRLSDNSVQRKGSPPRVRGKLSKNGPRGLHQRITPARAGKTVQLRRGARRAADHPRACGENLLIDTPERPYNGSPPRVRGKLRSLLGGTDGSRITPARAGKTLPQLPKGIRTADHPRACGENSALSAYGWQARGSPPRVRGKH